MSRLKEVSMRDAPALITTDFLEDAGLVRVHEQLDEDVARVRERLRSLVAPQNPKIQDPVMYAVEHTGRLLRPTLVLLSAYLLEGEPGAATDPRVIDSAAAVEILHIATLHHDDLIDDARIRRGRPTANAKYGPAVALLVGDYLLARCMQVAAELGVSHLKPMAETLVDVCVGQMLESSQLYDPLRSEEDYLAAISGKTARLMKAATALGALRSGASREAQEALASFGHHLGMAFQIWDDILDLCSDSTGKEIAKDLLNGVYTLPVIYAVQDQPDRLVSALRAQPLSDVQCREITALLHESGAIRRAVDTAQRHVDSALKAVESQSAFASSAPAVGRYLRGLVDRLAAQHPALQELRAGTGAASPPPAPAAWSTTAALAAVRDWLNAYITRPHELIGRTGAVCPFVSPSLRAGSLEIRTHTVGPSPSVDGITDLLSRALDEFDLIAWAGSNPTLRSLLVILPDLAPDQGSLLDDAHRAVKPEAVRRGVMIGQFHPSCPEPAARNRDFPVNRSPVPLVAIRAMALHDILFLKDKKEFFEEYHRRFGGYYSPGRDAIDPHFVELFHAACAAYGTGE
ncbi:polyprenyl synthetase family protein [Streptomyces sp. NPDC056835]|uniref:polyprenyl synthetase family protein n=1 Tax=Streptomyces sp. NPDC056835 TaxID=3345956 RepID=UPI0036C50E89